MSNNNINHISDKSVYVTFDPTGTDWPSTVTDVQDALSKIGGYAIKDQGLPVASRAEQGIIQLGTLDEVKAGTEDTKAVTPKVLFDYLTKPHATNVVWGTTRYATNVEAVDNANNEVSITPLTLAHVFKTIPATEARYGATMIATKTQAEAGVDDTVAMTPLKVKNAIDALVASSGDATESSKGVVKLATAQEIAAGQAAEGMAISPKGFASARGTNTAYGTFKAAQPNDMMTLVDQDKAVTPWVLGQTKAATDKFGIVKLVTDYSTVGNTALSGNANVMFKTGGIFSGDIYKGSNSSGNRYITATEANNSMPVGTVVMWIGRNMPNGNWAPLDGRWLNKKQYNTLYNIIGTMYGGDSNSFALMDMRGHFPRAWDAGRGTDSGRGLGTYQRCQAEAHQHISGALGEHPGHKGYNPYFGYAYRQGYMGSKGSIDWDNALAFTSDGRNGWNGERINTAGQIGNETRPNNMAVQFIIKIS